jgi:sulfur carrier protein ThiS
MSDLMVNPDDPTTLTDVDTSEGGEPDGTPSNEPVLNLDEYADFRIPVKVNGEEVLVPLQEAISGYSRTQDYTQKTQALASEREAVAQAAALQAALEEDPAATLAVLQAIYGSDTPSPEGEPDTELEPWERDLQDIKARFTQMDEAAAMAAMEQELLVIQQADGTDPNELLKFAAEKQIPNLEIAHLAYLGTLTQEQRAANLAKIPRPERSTTKDQDGFIAPGSGSSAAGSQPATTPPRDAREAALRAMSELGMV